MSLQFSFINNDNSLNNLNPPDPGLGLYAGESTFKQWAPPHIKPDSSEYMKHFYAPTHNPGIYRPGNNSQENIDLCKK
jgi:hypothetical protein